MNNKIIAIVVSVVVLTGAVVFCLANTAQRPPEPDASTWWERVPDKIVLSDGLNASQGITPTVKANVALCDTAIQGRLIKAELIYIPFMSGLPEVDAKVAARSADGELPGMPFVKYTIEVEKQLLGDKTEDVIEWVIPGAFDEQITKPTGDENVILFLNEGFREYYTAVAMEHSIFTVDEKNRLYSYSNLNTLAYFDGKPVNDLLKEVSRVEKELAKEPSFE